MLNGVKLKKAIPILSLDIYEINGLCTKMNSVVVWGVSHYHCYLPYNQGRVFVIGKANNKVQTTNADKISNAARC